MKLNIRINLGEGPFTVATSLQTIVAWERKFKRKASDMANGIGVEDLAYLAYECCKQAKVEMPVDFDSFVSKLDELEVVSEDKVSPFSPEPTGDS